MTRELHFCEPRTKARRECASGVCAGRESETFWGFPVSPIVSPCRAGPSRALVPRVASRCRCAPPLTGCRRKASADRLGLDIGRPKSLRAPASRRLRASGAGHKPPSIATRCRKASADRLGLDIGRHRSLRASRSRVRRPSGAGHKPRPSFGARRGVIRRGGGAIHRLSRCQPPTRPSHHPNHPPNHGQLGHIEGSLRRAHTLTWIGFTSGVIRRLPTPRPPADATHEEQIGPLRPMTRPRRTADA